MKIFLSEKVEHLGIQGEIKEVKPGYFLNYLGPKKLALKATAELMKKAEKIKEKRLIEKEERIKKAKELLEKLEGIVITFSKKTTAKDKLYGSISEKDIIESIEEQTKIKLEKKDIELKEAIKSTGDFIVPVRLNEDVVAKVKVKIEKSGEEETEEKEEKKGKKKK